VNSLKNNQLADKPELEDTRIYYSDEIARRAVGRLFDELDDVLANDNKPTVGEALVMSGKETLMRPFKAITRIKGITQIKVIGVGSAGSNIVDKMIHENIKGIEFIAVNTDKNELSESAAEQKIQIGSEFTRILGAGGDPAMGRRAAEMSGEDIADSLKNADMAFIVAGLGGGTGTGAAPVIAAIAKEMGILTIGVVTKPFAFEGRLRMRKAEAGILELKKSIDTLIIIPNQRLFEIGKIDKNLSQHVRDISDLIAKPGKITLDFADIHTIMSDKGVAYVGVGRASGKNRAEEAAQIAIGTPLTEASINGAKSMLVSISGDDSSELADIDAAMNIIRKFVSPEAEILFGITINDDLEDEIVITVIAADFDTA